MSAGIPESEQETRQWELGKLDDPTTQFEPVDEQIKKIYPRRAADIGSYEFESINEGRADKEPHEGRTWIDDVLIVICCSLASFIAAYFGNALASLP
jgi:hypothetical protein